MLVRATQAGPTLQYLECDYPSCMLNCISEHDICYIDPSRSRVQEEIEEGLACHTSGRAAQTRTLYFCVDMQVHW